MVNMRLLTVLSIAFLPALLLFTAEVPYAGAISLLLSTLVLWISELLPLAVTAMLVPCLAVIFGILTPEQAFSSFGSSTLGLFVGTFLIVRAVEKHGLDRRIAGAVLRLGQGRSAEVLVAAFTALSWILGMWMSNTATCAVLLPMALGILETSGAGKGGRLPARLLLTCAFVPSIGGMVTPVGSVPNAIAIQYLASHGVDMGFLQWARFALPVSVLLLAAEYVILRVLFPVGSITLRIAADSAVANDRTQLQIAAVMALVMGLWIVPDLMLQLGLVSADSFIAALDMPLALPPIIGAIILFALRSPDDSQINRPLLQSDDIGRIDWSTILLFGGGLCLGKALGESGLAAWMASAIAASANQGSAALPLLITLTSTIFSEVSSNTSTAAVLVPVVADLLHVLPAGQGTALTLGAVLAAGLGFMLPISTPPNALVFGTRRVALKEMVIAGLLLDIAGVVIISGYVQMVIVRG